MKEGNFNPSLDSQEWTEFFYIDDLAELGIDIKELRRDYDHLDSDYIDGQSWIVLPVGERKKVYHISDFLAWGTPWTGPKPEKFKDYTGYKPDTFFSMILITISDCGEAYKVSMYL